MKTCSLLLILLVYFGASHAQSLEPGRPKQKPVSLEVEIMGSGEIRLNDQPVGSLKDLSELERALQELFDRPGEKGLSIEQGSQAEGYGSRSRKVHVKAELSVSFAHLLEVLRRVRDAGSKPLDFVVADKKEKFAVSIPVTADADEDISRLAPNPLTLVVTVTPEQRFFLNGDAQKSLQALLVRLTGVFRARKRMKAYRPGSDDVEATLFLEADPSLSLARVVELLRALRKIGANPLGLKIDDLKRIRELGFPTAQPNKALQLTAR